MANKDQIDLTKKEEAIVSILWNSEEPLTVMDVCENSKRTGSILNQNTVQIAMNSMLKRKIVQVVGHEQHIKAFARTYKLTPITESYMIEKMKVLSGGANRSARSQFFSSFLGNKKITRDELEEIRDMVDKLIDD